LSIAATSSAEPALRRSTGCTGSCWSCFPAGPRQFLFSHQARALIATIRPRDIVGKTRRRLAVELIGELESIDKKIKAAAKDLSRSSSPPAVPR